MNEFIDDLSAENSTVTLEDAKTRWEEKKLNELMVKYNKIGTKDDANGSIANEFTNSYKTPKEVVLEEKKEEIYDNDYYGNVVITSDSKSILNTSLVEKVLSDNVLSESSSKTFTINGNYYLVGPWATGTLSKDDIRIKDTNNSKYYIVKVEVINSDSSVSEKYEAVKVLATNSSLVSGSLSYYLEQHKNEISAHDDEVYTYLQTQYADIFND